MWLSFFVSTDVFAKVSSSRQDLSSIMVTVLHPTFLFVLIGLQALVLVAGEPRTTWIKDTLTSHFSQPRHHVTNLPYKIAAREFIHDQFRGMGLTTVTHTFVSDNVDVKGVNVIGVMKGVHFNTANDSIVAISAHYDTERNTPGVNDNGAAVVVMLETARQLAAKKPRTSTVLFISFDLEESESASEGDVACTDSSSLCGSTKLVNDWLPSYFQNWPVTWKGLVNMDVVLNFDDRKNTQDFPTVSQLLFPDQAASVRSDQFEGDFLTVAGRSPEDSQFLKDFNSSWVKQGLPDFEIEIFPIPAAILANGGDFMRSDHRRFWEKNLSALFLSDSANFRGYMRQCYHEACDNITYATEERLKFVAKISRALVSWVDLTAPLADTSAAALLSACRLSILVATFGVIMTSQCLFRRWIG